MKKIAIVGAGAIGSVLGGYIAKAGKDVTLIDASWREHIETIKKHGLIISGSRGEQIINVPALFIDELEHLDKKIDLVFIAVKSYDTVKVLNLIAPYLADHPWVVSCQNGINEDEIGAVVGRENTIGCVVTFSGTLWEPGHATETRISDIGFTIGELDGQITPRIEEIAQILELCNKTRIVTDIWKPLWTKLADNSMTLPLTAITGMQQGDLLLNEKAHRLIARIAFEIIQVAEAAGHSIESIGGVDARLFRTSAESWAPEIDEIFFKRGQAFGGSYPSMLQDIIKGRPTEIDYLNGYVVRRGRELGIPTPVNEVLVGLVKGVEKGLIKPNSDKIDSLLLLLE
jgi:2-dehydropantoate 2-reductase